MNKITKHIERTLEEKSALAKESKDKWAKDHPLREPGTSLKMWKSYSRQRIPSRLFAENYQKIDWNAS